MKTFETFLLKFIFYWFKILGMATVSYDCTWSREKIVRTLVFKSSHTSIIYNILLIFFLISINFFFISKLEEDESNDDRIKFVVAVILYMFAIGPSIISIIFVFQHAKMASIANKINKLRELTIEQNIMKKNLFSIFFPNFIISISGTFLLQPRDNTDPIVVTGLNIFFIYFVLIQYTLILRIIKNFYVFVNDTLHEVSFKKYAWTFESLDLNGKIDKLIHLNSSLYEISLDVSSFYSAPMLWIILNIFIILVINIYVFVTQTLDTKIFDAATAFEIYLNILSLTTLVINVTNTITEVKMLYSSFI